MGAGRTGFAWCDRDSTSARVCDSPKRLHLPALMMAFSVGVLTGCRAQDQPPRDQSRAVDTVTAPPEVTLTVTDSLLQAPDTLSEGWTTFRLVNEGDEPERLEIYTYGDNHWDVRTMDLHWMARRAAAEAGMLGGPVAIGTLT